MSIRIKGGGSISVSSLGARSGAVSFFTDLGKFRRDPLNNFFQYALKFGDVVRYRGLWVTYQVTNPEHILQVLQANAANYAKDAITAS